MAEKPFDREALLAMVSRGPVDMGAVRRQRAAEWAAKRAEALARIAAVKAGGEMQSFKPHEQRREKELRMADKRAPAKAEIVAGAEGGLMVTVRVPTAEGELALVIDVERDPEGDWMVWVPWPERVRDGRLGDAERPPSMFGILPDGHEVVNGILYACAPEEEHARG
jgi:hypothetical protein